MPRGGRMRAAETYPYTARDVRGVVLPMTAPALTIVLPAYNEAARIGPALDELLAYLDQAPIPRSIEVLVVDDGSTDDTVKVVGVRSGTATTAPDVRVRVLRVPHGGKGAAVRAGMLAAEGEIVIFADADMATPPDQVPLLLDALQTSDVAIGSRIQLDGSDMRASQSPYRRLLGRIFHAIASVWVVGPVQDTQCGFKGFTRAAAQDLFSRQRITSIVFDVELVFLARRRGYRLAIVPIQWSDKRGSRMRARPGLALRVAWDLLQIPLLHRGIGRAAPAVE